MRRPRLTTILATTILVFSPTISRAQQTPTAPPTQGDANDLAKKLHHFVPVLFNGPSRQGKICRDFLRALAQSHTRYSAKMPQDRACFTVLIGMLDHAPRY